MGCTSSKLDPEDKEANRINASIERQIKQDKKTLDRTIKILLLGMSAPDQCYQGAAHPAIGAGESGKSTIIKQMRIIHSGGFPVDERCQHRAVIYSNLVVAFKVTLDIMETHKIEFERESSKVSNDRCALRNGSWH